MRIFRQCQDVLDLLREHLVWVELRTFLLHLGHQFDLHLVIVPLIFRLCAYALVFADLRKHIQVAPIRFWVLRRKREHLLVVLCR